MRNTLPFHDTTFCTALPSSYGDILVLWEGHHSQSLCRIYLPRDGAGQLDRARSAFPNMELWEKAAALPSTIESVIRMLQETLEGRPVQPPIPLIEESLKHLGVFQRKALLLEATIPFGYISTYRELARACGNPLATRAVARALSHNPLPLLIPCHRVIGSDGSLLGYQGGIGLKRHLLEREEIPFSSLAIDLKRANLWVFLS